jgi:hypothetical protein
MRQNLQAYINERAGHLAFICFARQQELQVDRRSGTGKLDLTIAVRQDGISSNQMFGVVVRGKETALRDRTASFAELYQNVSHNHGVTFPICLVLFTMADDCGYYKWADRANQPWQDLDMEGIHNLVEAVTAWHQTNVSSAA